MDNSAEQSRIISLYDSVVSYFRVQLVPLIVFAIMVVLGSILSSAFFTKANLWNLTIQVSISMIVSMGMLCVIISGGIDLSVGSLVALAGILIAGLMRSFTFSTAIILTFILVTAAGAVNGFIISKTKVAPFIVTLGMMEFARGCAYWYSNSASISWRGENGAGIMRIIGAGRFFSIPMPTIIWIIVVILMSIVIRQTVFGRIMYAIGGNEEAARLSGINLGIWKAIPYVVMGICCTLSGILLTARLGIGSVLSGEGLEVDCIAATVIGGASLNGGRGTVSGVIIGVFILGIISNLLDLMNVAQYPQMMLKGAIVVCAVLLSSWQISGPGKKSTAK